MKKVYSGFLSEDEFGSIRCGDRLLIEDMAECFKVGDKVFLRYFIADNEMTEDEAEQALIMKSLGAPIDRIEFDIDAYTEYSIMSYKEGSIIGGHDLASELANSEGKYLLLIIETV